MLNSPISQMPPSYVSRVFARNCRICLFQSVNKSKYDKGYNNYHSYYCFFLCYQCHYTRTKFYTYVFIRLYNLLYKIPIFQYIMYLRTDVLFGIRMYVCVLYVVVRRISKDHVARRICWIKYLSSLFEYCLYIYIYLNLYRDVLYKIL